MLTAATNDNYRPQTRAERIENIILLAIGWPLGIAFWAVLAYGIWQVLAG